MRLVEMPDGIPLMDIVEFARQHGCTVAYIKNGVKFVPLKPATAFRFVQTSPSNVEVIKTVVKYD